MKSRIVGGTAIALGVLLGASIAAGQKKGVAPLKLDVKENTAALESSDPNRIETAIVNIRMAGKDGGGKALTPALIARLKAGLPRELIKKALETLGELEDPAAVEGCDVYMAHRDAEVRSVAVKCLGGSKGPAAVKSLRAALSDPDARVHAYAATLLGEAKATDALPDLIAAFDKGVNEAAVSIGMLCDAKSCDVLSSQLKSKPLDVVFSGLQQVLARKEIPDDVKKKIITQVRELSSGKAREFLESVRKAWPANGSKPVADALDKAIKDLEGAK